MPGKKRLPRRSGLVDPATAVSEDLPSAHGAGDAVGAASIHPAGRTAVVLSYDTARYRLALPLLVRRTMAFSARPDFDPWLVEAVKDFYGVDMDVTTAESEILEDDDERIRFFPWFLWDWRRGPGEPSLGERFLADEVHEPHEARLLEGLCASYVGLYEALDDADERGVTLRELETGEVLEVVDDGLEGDLGRGEVLQARLVRVPAVPGDHHARGGSGGGSRGCSRGPHVVLVDAVYAVLPAEALPAVAVEVASLPRDLPVLSHPRHVAVYKACTPDLLESIDLILDALSRPVAPVNADGDPLVLARCDFAGCDLEPVLEAVSRLVDVGVLRPVPTPPPSGRGAAGPAREALTGSSPGSAPGSASGLSAGLFAWDPKRRSTGRSPRAREAAHGFVELVPARGDAAHAGRPARVALGASSPRRLDMMAKAVASAAGVPTPRLRTFTDFPAAAAQWSSGIGRSSPWILALSDVAEATRVWLSTWALSWIDMPQAALGDLTPREAVRWVDGRREVARILDRVERLPLDRPGLGPIPELDQDLAVIRRELQLD